MAESVTVIIPNWNGRLWLEQCLPTLAAQTYADFKVVVVDNGSHDGSAAWLAEQWPNVWVIRNDRNVGFAAAVNQAVRVTAGEYVVVLNNDVRAEPEWLAELVAAADRGAASGAGSGAGLGAGSGVGMVASCIWLAAEPGVLDSTGIEVDRAGIAWNRGWKRQAANPGVDSPVFGPSGAAALYRRSMLDDIGLFDEDFFAYYEDVDLAWRAQWAGRRCTYAQRAVVHHVHSATGGRDSPLKTRLLARNRIWCWIKNYPFPHLLLYGPIFFLIDLLSLGAALARGRGYSALKGRAEALKGLPRMLTKRRRLVRRLPARAMIARLRPLRRTLLAPRR